MSEVPPSDQFEEQFLAGHKKSILRVCDVTHHARMGPPLQIGFHRENGLIVSDSAYTSAGGTGRKTVWMWTLIC